MIDFKTPQRFYFGKLGYNWNADDADWANFRGFFLFLNLNLL
jgi:hypothetical protein